MSVIALFCIAMLIIVGFYGYINQDDDEFK